MARGRYRRPERGVRCFPPVESEMCSLLPQAQRRRASAIDHSNTRTGRLRGSAPLLWGPGLALRAPGPGVCARRRPSQNDGIRLGEGGADGRNAIFRVAGSEVAEGEGDDAVLEHVLSARRSSYDEFDKLMEFKIASTGGNGEPLSVRNSGCRNSTPPCPRPPPRARRVGSCSWVTDTSCKDLSEGRRVNDQC